MAIASKSTFVSANTYLSGASISPVATPVYSGPTTSSPTYNFIDGTAGDDYVWAEAGNDRVWAGAGNDQVFGGTGNDTLFGDSGFDTLYGEAGSDVLWGGDWMDFLWGGADRDYLFGEAGTDEMHGGTGDDMLWGGDDGDQIFGDDGNDYLYGQDWDDTLDGGRGNDHLDGDWGRDTLYGGADNDQLYGRDDDDRLYAGDGDDRLDGGRGGDSLEGNAGNDVLYGGATQFYGDYDYDHLAGGSGADRFVFKATDVTTSVDADGTTIYHHYRDVIGDFSREEGDKIDIGSMLLFIAGFNGSAQQAIDQGYLLLEEGPGHGGTQVNVRIDPNGFAPDPDAQGSGVFVAILSGTTLAEVGAEDFLVTSLGTNTQPVMQLDYMLMV